jgi:hypothetical protein
MFGEGLPPGMHQPQPQPNYPAACGRERGLERMTPFYVAGVCLVAAQLLGIYALVTHKADFTFALIMMVLVVVALASGADGVYRQLH